MSNACFRQFSEKCGLDKTTDQDDCELSPVYQENDGVSPPERQRIGNYELLERLGHGGMGIVFKAIHVVLHKVVAIKMLSRAGRAGDLHIERFLNEMRAVGRLDHPHIVKATDAGVFDGRHCLVMEYLEGVDLADLLKQEGSLDVGLACAAIRDAALGLQCISEAGLVHRDLKPSNLFVATSGEVKILDLGLVRIGAASELTASDALLGTLDYIAPEQADAVQLVDFRADIYSLGCTLFKLLTGCAPYENEDNAKPLRKLMAHANGPIPEIEQHEPRIPLELAAVVRRMLQKHPADRHQSALEVARALEPFVGDDSRERLATIARRYADRRAEQQLGPHTDLLSSVSRTGDEPVSTEDTVPIVITYARPWRRWAIVVIAMACAVIALVLADRPSAEPVIDRESPHDKTMSAGGNSPGTSADNEHESILRSDQERIRIEGFGLRDGRIAEVFPLIWEPGDPLTEDWKIDQALNRMRVAHVSPALLQLANPQVDDYEFSIKMTTPEDLLRVGVFFGLRTDPEDRSITYETIEAGIFEEKMWLYRITHTIRFTGFERNGSRTYNQIEVPMASEGPQKLTLKFKRNELDSIAWNDEDHSELLRAVNPGVSPYVHRGRGPLGVYVLESSTVFSDPTFNGTVIRMEAGRGMRLYP